MGQGGQNMGGKGGGSPYGGNVFQNASTGLQSAQNTTQQAQAFNPYMIQPGGLGASSAMKVGGNWGYDPSMAANMTGPGGYSSQSLAGTNLNQYMNPWTQNVINNSMSSMDDARQMAMNNTGAQASSGNAFGGDRHALMEAQNNKDFYRNVGDMSSNLNMQGFQNAQNMALSDINNQNQASQFNIGNDMQTRLANLQNAQFNAGNKNQAAQWAQQAGLQAAMANASNATNAGMNASRNRLAAEQSNQGAWQNAMNLRMNAGNQQGNLANLGFGMGQGVQSGNQQQAAFQRMMQQQLIDSAKAQYGQYQNAPYQNLNMLNSVGSGINPGQTDAGGGSLFGDVAGTAASMYGMYLMSDARLKDNIEHIGEHRGHRLYTWAWNKAAQAFSDRLGPAIGVLAQEVAQSSPEAVTEGPEGYLMVNYGAL